MQGYTIKSVSVPRIDRAVDCCCGYSLRYLRSCPIGTWIFVVGLVLCATLRWPKSVLEYACMSRHIAWALMTLMLLIYYKQIRLGTIHIFAFGYLLFVLLSGTRAANKAEWLWWSLRCVLVVTFLSVVVVEKRPLAKLMIVLGIIFTVYFWYEYYQKGEFEPMRGLMRQKNWWSAAHFFVIPFCYYAIKEKFWRKISILLMAIMIVHIVLLRSRSVMCALFVTGLIALYYQKGLKKKLFVGYIIFACTCLAVLFHGKILDSQSAKWRLDQWLPTLSMIKENPAGVGVGNWKIMFPAYAPDIDFPGAYTEATYNFPHNDWLWIWSETGPGILFYIGMFICALWYARKEPWLVMALLGYMTIACFTALRERPFPSIMLMVLFVVACPRKKIIRHNEIPIILMVLVLVVLGFRARASYYDKIIVNKKFGWDIKRMAAAEAHTPFTNLCYAGRPYYLYQGRANFLLGDKRVSASQFTRAFAYNPYNVHALNGMGVSCLIRGDRESAKRFFKIALEIAPHFEEAKKSLESIK